MPTTIYKLEEHLSKMEKDAKDECHAYAMRFLKSTEPADRHCALALEMKVNTINRIQNFIKKGK